MDVGTVVFVMFSACVVTESRDGIRLAHGLMHSPILDTAFQAGSDGFPILVSVSEQL